MDNNVQNSINRNLIVVFLAFMSVLAACTSSNSPTSQLIPAPVEMEIVAGYYPLDSAKCILEGIDAAVDKRIDTTLTELGPEGYLLKVTPSAIELAAPTIRGIFYGKQTLLQLMTAKGIPCVKIKDYPRFSYRGIHLDVSRHFFPKEQILKILDEMAYYKLNTFHFHLTDNGGWRIQIDKYPQLTSLGAYRSMKDWDKWWENPVREFVTRDTPGAYGGYYTKDDIREIVRYATERHIEVIPEIEFPAHSDEVFVGYPELCCQGKAYTSGEFCVGNKQSFIFMEDVLTEIMELFPSPYIHIGGDEARKVAWRTCPKCQGLMKRMGMCQLDELQCYMIAHAEKFLNERGRIMIGWDEILKNDLHSSSIVMSYRGEKGAIEAANRGSRAIMTPGEVLYFDWYQAAPATQPKAMYGYSPLKKMYSFNPVPTDAITASRNEELISSKSVSPDTVAYIQPENKCNIIGVQGSTWTEYIPNASHLEYMMFPRLLAIAEMAWTPQSIREWESFKKRVNEHLPKLKARKINTFMLSDVIELTSQICSEKTVKVTLDTEKTSVEIRYTLDGTEPCENSTLYTEPFILTKKTVVKAALFRDGKLVGIPLDKVVGISEDIQNYYEYINEAV
jgi:hexosaminidase